jgi:hypothetical protein
VRNFSQFVSMLIEVQANTLSVGRTVEAAVQTVASNFERVPAVISKPPKSLAVAVNTLADYFPEQKPHKMPKKPMPAASKGKAPEKDATEQSLTISGDASKFTKWLKRPGMGRKKNIRVAEIVQGYLSNSPSKYRFKKGVLTKNGTPIDADTLFQRVVLPTDEEEVNLDVAPRKWTFKTLEAMQGEKFYILDGCCRHDHYCYRHGNRACGSYSKQAVQTGYAGVSHWILKNRDIGAPHFVYHQMTVDCFSKHEESAAYSILRTTIAALSAAAIGLLVTHLFGSFFKTYFGAVEQAGYGRRGALIAKKAHATVPVPNLGGAQPQHQEGTLPTEEVATTDWIVKKLSGNVIPIAVSGANKVANCQMTRIFANIAISVAHSFFEGAQQISLGGTIATTYPIVEVSNAKAFTDMGPVVQILRDRKVDLCVLLLPKALYPCKDLRNYLIRASETTIPQLRAMVIATRRLIDVPITVVDGKRLVTPTVLENLTEFPLGDAIEQVEYTTPTLRVGVSIKMAKPTLDKMCGLPVFTSNHYVGHNHQIIAGIHAALHDFHNVALMAPFPYEVVEALLRDIDPKALNMAHLQGTIRVEPGLVGINDKMLPIQTLPRGHEQYQNTNNTIRPSPIHDALIGMEFDHPVTKEHVVVKAPVVVASPIWKLKEPFEKAVKHDHVPTPEDFNKLRAASQKVKERILANCDPRLLVPRDDLFTIAEALNGISDLNIPGLDPKKSFGYDKDFPKYIRERVLLPGSPLQLRPEFAAIVERATTKIREGKTPIAYVVANLKEELRRIGKFSRVTSCYNFLLLVTMRRFNMHIPAMLISGRVHNGTSFGADLSGPEGKVYMDAEETMRYTSSFDAKNFDASISSTVSGESEEMCADFTQMPFPFLSRAAALIPVMLNRFVLLIVGAIVYFFWHSRQSGHNLTTPLNIVDASTVAQVAWDESNPPYGDTLTNAAVSRAYGDDFIAAHNNRNYTNPHISAVAARYGINLTPGMKFGPASDFDPVRQHLSRMTYRDATGYVFAPLNVEVIDHIHAFIRGKDRNYTEAVRQNAEASLREWFQYGRPVFEMAKERINRALRQNSFSAIPLDYDVLYVDWMKKNGISVKQTTPVPEGDFMHAAFGAPSHNIGAARPQSGITFLGTPTDLEKHQVHEAFREIQSRMLTHRATGLHKQLTNVELFHLCLSEHNTWASLMLQPVLELMSETVVDGKVLARMKVRGLPRLDGAKPQSLITLDGEEVPLDTAEKLIVHATHIRNLVGTHNELRDEKLDDGEVLPHRRDDFSEALDIYNIIIAHTGVQLSVDYDYVMQYFMQPRIMARLHGARNQSSVNTTPKPVVVGAEVRSTASDNDTVTTKTANEMAINPTATTTGVASQSALTKHVESTVKSVTVPTKEVMLSYAWELNPYPPVGSEKLLCKEYELPPITWLTADAAGTQYAAGAMSFPEVLFTIPKIVETLGAIRFFKLGIVLKVSMTPNPYAGGRLFFSHCQATLSTTNWRQAWPCCLNLPGLSIGPCLGGTRTMEIVPASHRDAFDIVNLAPEAMMGTLRAWIQSPLSWMSTSPPTGLTVNLFVQVVQPTLAGYGLNPGPAGMNPIAWYDGIKRLTGARPQSAISEAGDKASTGILSGVSSAVSTVTALIKDAGPLLELAALDKPYENSVVVPIRHEVASDMCYTQGVAQSTFLSQRPNSYVSVDNKQCFEANPRPNWDSVFGTPGYIGNFYFDYNDAAESVIWSRSVFPTMGYTFQAGAGYNNTLMTPVGFFAMYHKYWHGDFCFLFRFTTASQQSCSVRFSILPDANNDTAVPRDQSGDVQGLVYTIKGDTDIFIPVYYLSSRKQSVVVGPDTDESVPFSINSTLVAQIVSPISADVTAASARVQCDIYMCALPGFVLDMPGNVMMSESGGYTAELNPGAPALTRLDGARNQASVRDLLGAADFPPISKSTRRTHTGMCDPDRSSGPIEALKRFRRVATQAALTGGEPLVVTNTQYGNTPIWEWSICWAYWSGSLTFKVCLTDTQVGITTTGFLRAIASTGTSYVEDFSGGMITVDISKQPFLTFALPYTSLDAVTEVENVHSEATTVQALIQFLGPASPAPLADIYQAVGDDYCLYRFQCTPLITHTFTPVNKSKGKGKEKTPKKFRRPVPSDDDDL